MELRKYLILSWTFNFRVLKNCTSVELIEKFCVLAVQHLYKSKNEKQSMFQRIIFSINHAELIENFSVESSVLTPKDVQKNRDTNVKTKVQITKADRSRVEELTPAVMNGKIAKIFQQDGNLTINKRTSNREPNSNKSKKM